MGKNRNEKPKYRYPSRRFAVIFWIILGITFPLIFILLAITDMYSNYSEGIGYGFLAWGIFCVASILYTVNYNRKGIRFCPKCGNQIYNGKKHCDSCGARVWWECPKCGKKTKKHKKFCECGQNVRVVTFSRQVEIEGEIRHEEDEPIPKVSNIVVTGSVVQFCPSCGAEISEDLTHCSICGSKFDR